MLVRRLLRVTKVNGSITASARGAAIAGERLLWAGERSGWARGHASPKSIALTSRPSPLCANGGWSGVTRLINAEFRAARQSDPRDQAPAFIFHRLAGDFPRVHFFDKRRDVVAH